jgi:hypothetical protein
MSKLLDGSYIPRRCARRLCKEKKAKTLRTDPYSLAYRYVDYMKAHQMRHRQDFNQYYENLLANQPDPGPDAMDDRSRAIRYAKEHFESYYEIRDIARIVGWLEEAEEKQVLIDMTTLLADIGSPSQSTHETSSP